MARIRTIKPQFFLNEELAELSAMVRLLFIGLWTQADREGRLLDRPKRLKAEIFPYDNFDVEKGLHQLSEAGFIHRYKVNVNVTDRVLAPEQPKNELALIQVINFSKHQKIDKPNEKESDLPSRTNIDYKKTIDSLSIDEERNGKECNGKERSALFFKNPFSDNFLKDWDLWKKFKKDEFSFSYKTVLSEQAAVNELVNLSKGDEAAAKRIIDLSIANGWKGFFELKTEKNGNSKNFGQPGSESESIQSAFAKIDSMPD